MKFLKNFLLSSAASWIAYIVRKLFQVWVLQIRLGFSVFFYLFCDSVFQGTVLLLDCTWGRRSLKVEVGIAWSLNPWAALRTSRGCGVDGHPLPLVISISGNLILFGAFHLLWKHLCHLLLKLCFMWVNCSKDAGLPRSRHLIAGFPNHLWGKIFFFF